MEAVRSGEIAFRKLNAQHRPTSTVVAALADILQTGSESSIAAVAVGRDEPQVASRSLDHPTRLVAPQVKMIEIVGCKSYGTL
jgi:hypothetical protein